MQPAIYPHVNALLDHLPAQMQMKKLVGLYIKRMRRLIYKADIMLVARVCFSVRLFDDAVSHVDDACRVDEFCAFKLNWCR
jgi:hypothetical protein